MGCSGSASLVEIAAPAPVVRAWPRCEREDHQRRGQREAQAERGGHGPAPQPRRADRAGVRHGRAEPSAATPAGAAAEPRRWPYRTSGINCHPNFRYLFHTFTLMSPVEKQGAAEA
jgi:hypothetical protein